MTLGTKEAGESEGEGGDHRYSWRGGEKGAHACLSVSPTEHTRTCFSTSRELLVSSERHGSVFGSASFPLLQSLSRRMSSLGSLGHWPRAGQDLGAISLWGIPEPCLPHRPQLGTSTPSTPAAGHTGGFSQRATHQICKDPVQGLAPSSLSQELLPQKLPPTYRIRLTCKGRSSRLGRQRVIWRSAVERGASRRAFRRGRKRWPSALYTTLTGCARLPEGPKLLASCCCALLLYCHSLASAEPPAYLPSTGPVQGEGHK